MKEALLVIFVGSIGAIAYLFWRLTTLSKQFAHSEEKNLQLTKGIQELEENLITERDFLLNALNDAFMLLDSEGTIIFANKPTSDLLNGRVALNRNLKEVFLDERFTSPIIHCIETKEPVKKEITLPRLASPRGKEELHRETAWIINAELIEWTSQTSLTRVIIRDVTTEHYTEQVRKDFVANASHELRTPLAIINGYLENLLEDNMLENPKTSRKFLTVMRKHGKRISRIVEEMLLISRLESHEITRLSTKTFNLAQCIKDVIERLEPVISGQKAEILMDIEDESIEITADRFYLTQVFFNLIENALKQNRHIFVQIKIGTKSIANNQIEIWISDNGIGIPAGDVPFVFRRFYRVAKHHNQNNIKGTGLGLSIVKRAIEAHRGSIDVKSIPGQQTTFTIKLPINTK